MIHKARSFRKGLIEIMQFFPDDHRRSMVRRDARRMVQPARIFHACPIGSCAQDYVSSPALQRKDRNHGSLDLGYQKWAIAMYR